MISSQGPFYIPGSFEGIFWRELREQLKALENSKQIKPCEIHDCEGELVSDDHPHSTLTAEASSDLTPKKKSLKSSSAAIITKPINNLVEAYSLHFYKNVKNRCLKEKSENIFLTLKTLREISSFNIPQKSVAATLLIPKFRSDSEINPQIEAREFPQKIILGEIGGRLKKLEGVVKGEDVYHDLDLCETLEVMYRLMLKYSNLNVLSILIRAIQRRRELYFEKYTKSSKSSLIQWRETKRPLINKLERRFSQALMKLNTKMPLMMLLTKIKPEQLVQTKLVLTSCSNTEQLLKEAQIRLENCRTLMTKLAEYQSSQITSVES